VLIYGGTGTGTITVDGTEYGTHVLGTITSSG
jgi:hypothetical protein